MKRLWSIKTWFYGVLFVVVTPVALLAFYSIYAQYDAQIQDIESQAASLARMRAEDTIQLIQDGREILERMIRRPLIRAVDSSRCDPILLDTSFWSSHFANLTVVDKTGQVICNSLGLPLETLPSYRGREWFPRVFGSQAFLVGAPVIGGTMGLWVAPLVYPIIDESGAMVGALSMTLDLARLNLAVPSAAPAGTSLAIVDSSGKYVGRSNALEGAREWQGRTFADPDMLRAALAAQVATLRYRESDDVDRIFGFAPVPGAEWQVIASLPVETVLAGVRNSVYASLTVVILASALSLAVGALIIRTIERPISSIATAARAWTQENFAARATESGPAEISAVVRQFNLMLEQRLRAERDQRAREEQLRLITDNLPALVAYVDANERLQFINKPGQVWLATTASAVIGRPISEAVGQDRGVIIRARIRATLAGQNLRPFEERLTYPDGVERWVRLVYVPDHAADGGVRGCFVMITDISEGKRIEAQLLQAQKMEAVGTLTGGLAHDFNNLLGIIIGNLDLVDEFVADRPDITELAGDALQAATRGAELTRRLLAFARRQPLHPEPLSLNAHVKGISRLLRRVLGEHVEVRLDLAEPLWSVTVDPAQLEAAITNLATNARDAMPGGGVLTIATRNRRLDEAYATGQPDVMPGDYATIEVSDTGDGIPAEIIDHIFEPFFTTKRDGKGSGLGLSMVFGFAKQSGGHVTIDSEAGRGTVFRLFFPKNSEALAAGIVSPSAAGM